MHRDAKPCAESGGEEKRRKPPEAGTRQMARPACSLPPGPGPQEALGGLGAPGAAETRLWAEPLPGVTSHLQATRWWGAVSSPPRASPGPGDSLSVTQGRHLPVQARVSRL